MIELKNISISFDENIIIDKLDLEIKENKLISILGVNGSGKSTLIKAINKINKYDGEIKVDNKNIDNFKLKDYSKVVSMLSQHPEIDGNIKVIDLIKMGRYTYSNAFGGYTKEDKEKVDEAIRITKIEHLLDKYIFDLSGGQRQKVWISMILAQDTKYIFLDEPTSYLDINHQLEVLQILRKLVSEHNKTIIFSHHDLNQAFKYSDEVIVLDNGKLAKQGVPEEVFTKELLQNVYKVDCEINIEEKEISKINLRGEK